MQMLQIIVFELALLIGMVASLNKDNMGLAAFGWISTVIFIAWGIIQGLAVPAVIQRF
jgi:hypothetical protein